MVSVKVLKPNLTVVCIGRVQLWFSYSALVAFEHPAVQGGRRVVSENQWTTTTGKHLTEIDGGNKKLRMNGEAFNDLVAKYVDTIGEEPKGGT